MFLVHATWCCRYSRSCIEEQEVPRTWSRVLRHVERCALLLYVLSIDDAVLFDEHATITAKAKSLKTAFEILQKELGEYHPDLLKKPVVIGVNKIDLYDDKLRKAIMKLFPTAMLFSAATHEGLDAPKRVLFTVVYTRNSCIFLTNIRE